ncbi:type II toxin-antitoxin system VapC family toxin [Sphingomonas sp.]|uniref:type II toxin-antitoxin system VapC family toxin n=1 Tax=Sphingomonas sp. TaxID=28214 RepID=UPI002DD668D0|nr:type II toxin-antitoxin system VapC family toxin [Sphingomonas sp.]
MIVVDASLLVKLLVPEPDSGMADAWMRCTVDVSAPDLVAIEVAQAIVRRVNDRRATVGEGERALGGWHDLLANGSVALVRTTPGQVEEAALIAMQIGHPVRDCVYLALAIEHRGTLVTCDARFQRRAVEVYPDIRLLADYVAS